MNGKLMVGGLVVMALITGAGLWYSRTFAYYERTDGLSEVSVLGQSLRVSNYRAIDASTSPLKLRACFQVDWDFVPSDSSRIEAEPLVAPFWFDCFDAQAISKDIQTGVAVALLAGKNKPFGFSRFIAQYPDGRAFMWRQINACGRAQFDGDTLPGGCDQVTFIAPDTAPKPGAKTPGVISAGAKAAPMTLSQVSSNAIGAEFISHKSMHPAQATSLQPGPWAWFMAQAPQAPLGLQGKVYQGIHNTAHVQIATGLPCLHTDLHAEFEKMTEPGNSTADSSVDSTEYFTADFGAKRAVWPRVTPLEAVHHIGRVSALGPGWSPELIRRGTAEAGRKGYWIEGWKNQDG